MSSSEYLRRLELPDLGKPTPPAPKAPSFSEQLRFEKVERARREPSPDEAHAAGLIEGERRGREAAGKEMAPIAEQLREAAKGLTGVRALRLEALETELVDVATQLVRVILRAELRQGGDSVLNMARACLAEAASEGASVLRVSPADLELVRAHVPELELDLADGAVRVEADPGLSPGELLLETPTRVYDGRPQRLLEAAARGAGGAR